MGDCPKILNELQVRFPGTTFGIEPSRDGIPTVWVPGDDLQQVLRFLKEEVPAPYRMLFDLTAIDERARAKRDEGNPSGDFTGVYHLLSMDRNSDIRVKVSLSPDGLSLPTLTGLWPSANWYEREVWDMFGIRFEGHPNLRRILMPDTWVGHPLRKDHPARATEMGPFVLPDDKQKAEQEALRFSPEEWGMSRGSEDHDFMFLNLGPQHPGMHGVLRFVVQLDGERIVDAVPEIGYHHRGAEKMGERQTWHTYIPYTDRIDYLGGVLNNMPYVLSVEALSGITVPARAQVIRVMMCELFRIASHLVWYGTFAQDLGQMSPVFYTFNDRERILEIVQAFCGARMHPAWFRIGGVAQDLPKGWEKMVREFLDYMPARLDEYDDLVMRNNILRARTVGIGEYSAEEAVEWGVTGPGLRACGVEWDFRKKRPYSGYDQFEFDIPTAQRGDCYGRALVRVEEMRQSLRIIEQCLKNMPEGPYKSREALAVPPPKDRTLHDIETLIPHFLGVTWGPVVPPGQAAIITEASKGANAYYLVSDGNTHSYRTRIRVPSFPHIQMAPMISRGFMIADLLAIVASIDFVLADVDR
ncbi:MAG TPA: NADH-quinone oxidoreductase subunit C/D [Candidatus Sumerlaeota bacterium]|nr:NADH-quinone oxidoreductase subunit C/D [Candidatus Sumerlaeota bacterium]